MGVLWALVLVCTNYTHIYFMLLEIADMLYETNQLVLEPNTGAHVILVKLSLCMHSAD